jgi:hypothetical protein
VSLNELFYKVMLGAFILLILMGFAMTAILLSTDDPTIAVRIIGAFTGALTAVLGFASGFLLGRRNGNGNGHGKGLSGDG